jgi:hypothetical protein
MSINEPTGEDRGAERRSSRVVPEDLYDASRRSQQGEMVDISPLVPSITSDVGDMSNRDDIQRIFDHVSTIVSSKEYSNYVREVMEALSEVRGQDFIFDIEGTCLNPVENYGGKPEIVYYANPWLKPVIEILTRNGNRVGFWTSASAERLTEMRRAMSSEMAALPAITREGFEQVANAFQAKSVGKLGSEQVLGVMKSVYSTANEATFQASDRVFDEDTLGNFRESSRLFLDYRKYPQFFMSPANGFFVDNGRQYIEVATRYGWPEDRAILCKDDFSREDATRVMHAITSAVFAK